MVLSSSSQPLEEIIEEETREAQEVQLQVIDAQAHAHLNIERIYREAWEDAQVSFLGELSDYFGRNAVAMADAEEIR